MENLFIIAYEKDCLYWYVLCQTGRSIFDDSDKILIEDILECQDVIVKDGHKIFRDDIKLLYKFKSSDDYEIIVSKFKKLLGIEDSAYIYSSTILLNKNDLIKNLYGSIYIIRELKKKILI